MLATNLALGTLMISLTVVIHTFGLMGVTHVMSWVTDRIRLHGHRSRMLAMNTVVIGVFAVLTAEVWFHTDRRRRRFRNRPLFLDHHLLDGRLWRCRAPSGMAHAGSAGRRQRLPADRLVHRLSDRRRHAGGALQVG